MKIVSHMTVVLTNVKSRFALSRRYWGVLDKVGIVKEWRMKLEQPQLRAERSAVFLRSGRCASFETSKSSLEYTWFQVII